MLREDVELDFINREAEVGRYYLNRREKEETMFKH